MQNMTILQTRQKVLDRPSPVCPFTSPPPLKFLRENHSNYCRGIGKIDGRDVGDLRSDQAAHSPPDFGEGVRGGGESLGRRVLGCARGSSGIGKDVYGSGETSEARFVTSPSGKITSSSPPPPHQCAHYSVLNCAELTNSVGRWSAGRAEGGWKPTVIRRGPVDDPPGDLRWMLPIVPHLSTHLTALLARNLAEAVLVRCDQLRTCNHHLDS